MKNFWKMFLVVLTVLSLLFAFAACGETEENKIQDVWNDFEGAIDNIKDDLNDLDLGDVSGDIEDAVQGAQDAAGNIQDAASDIQHAADDIKEELEDLFGGNG